MPGPGLQGHPRGFRLGPSPLESVTTYSVHTGGGYNTTIDPAGELGDLLNKRPPHF